MNAIERLNALESLLAEYAHIHATCITAGGQDNHSPAIAFKCAFEFGQRSLRSAALLLEHGRDVGSAIAVVRGFYELTMRILWASREPCGWPRFAAYYATQEQKWANAVRSSPGSSDASRRAADQVLKISSDCLTKLNCDPMKSQLDQVMDDIEKKDLDLDQLDCTGTAKFQYNMVYRLMCRPAHGNLFPIFEQWTQPDLSHLVASAAWATLSLLRAMCAVSATNSADNDAKVEAVGKRVHKILLGLEELSLDDVPPP
jgi:hypothetical protein